MIVQIVRELVPFKIQKNEGNHGRYYCVHCLRLGHWSSVCRFLVTCHECNQPYHCTLQCLGPGPEGALGFVPNKATTECFQGEFPVNGKNIDISQWFKGKMTAPNLSIVY
jgi:hypothetical protein